MIRFATIGTNFITDWFLEAALKNPNLFYAVTYSRNPETAQHFAHKHGAQKISTDLNALAADPSVDAVYVASPNSLHFEQAALMLSHGKHVLCEKTITSNLQELTHLIQLSNDHKVVLLEAMRSVYMPGFSVLQENLSQIGTIRHVTFQFCKYSSRYDRFLQGIIDNAFQSAFSNGALMDLGVYCIHPLVRLFGMPQSLHASAVLLKNGVDGAGSILAHYPDMEAQLIYSKISDNHLPSQIQGEEGTLLIQGINRPYEITLLRRDGSKECLFSDPENQGLTSVVNMWESLITSGCIQHPYHVHSLMELQFMDEVRRQTNLVFPADSVDLKILEGGTRL